MIEFIENIFLNPFTVENLVFISSILGFLFFILFKNVISSGLLRLLQLFFFKKENLAKIKLKFFTSVKSVLSFFVLVLAFYILGKGVEFKLMEKVSLSSYFSLLSLLFKFGAVWFAYVLVDPLMEQLNSLKKKLGKTIFSWFVKTVKVLVAFLGLTIVLSYMGISVVSLIASLGIVGMAVALGAQDMFKNIISGFIIISEKRFKIGDIVKLSDGTEGVVEKIGFRSTSIRAFDKTIIYVSNSNFSEGSVVNYSLRPYRRILWNLGLEYDTSSKDLKKIRDEISKYIEKSGSFVNNEELGYEVRIDSFQDSSINILVICFANTADFSQWLKIKEDLLLEIKEIVEERVGASFAFPSQTLYVNNK
ncbi:MAG: mechanosensitive ion channel family protein [Alphaproteobacteria bacterium]|jgi:MscS family membrane protein|nr:mechanosensitive ion channel family protein [Alphaproteobacteria bacterium]